MQVIRRDAAVVTEFGAHLAPQLEVEGGERFLVETNDNLWNLGKQKGLAAAIEPPLAALQVIRGNPLAGPVAVAGADPGDTLIVEIETIAVRDWGWTGLLPGAGVLDGRVGWDDCSGPFSTIIEYESGPSGTLTDGEAVMTLDREVRWPLRPFIGTIATAPERGAENSVITAGPWGGNIDVRDIAAGNRIHLNVGVTGALLFLGDVHGSQGDSELTGVANETAADITLHCDVLKNRRVPGVCRIEKPDSLVQVDSARNAGSPEAALNGCFVNMIAWLAEDYGLSKREAYLHMTANSGVRAYVYQFCLGLFTCGVEFPKACL